MLFFSSFLAAANSKGKNTDAISHLASCPANEGSYKETKGDGKVDEHIARNLMRSISTITQAEGKCQCLSKSKIDVHHLRAHTPISYLGLSPL